MTERWFTGITATTKKPVDFNTNVPHSARIWNYWLGGKDNFAADRAAGDQVRQIFPGIEGSPLPYHLRSPEQIAGFFEGLELAEPGVLLCSRWRPEPGSPADDEEVEVYSGVARKP